MDRLTMHHDSEKGTTILVECPAYRQVVIGPPLASSGTSAHPPAAALRSTQSGSRFYVANQVCSNYYHKNIITIDQ